MPHAPRRPARSRAVPHAHRAPDRAPPAPHRARPTGARGPRRGGGRGDGGLNLNAFDGGSKRAGILAANFRVLRGVLEAEPDNLVVGDEAWDVNYSRHENPELRRGAFAWLTDFVGWLPVDPADRREAA